MRLKSLVRFLGGWESREVHLATRRTEIWMLTNKKPAKRRGRVQLVNAVDFGQKIRKSLGSKRKELRPEDIEHIVRLYGKFEPGEHSKIFDNADFGYSTLTVERPLRAVYTVSSEVAYVLAKSLEPQLGPQAATVRHALAALEGQTFKTTPAFSSALRDALKSAPSFGELLLGKLELNPKQLGELAGAFAVTDPKGEIVTKKGKPMADSSLRDTENVPLKDDIKPTSSVRCCRTFPTPG